MKRIILTLKIWHSLNPEQVKKLKAYIYSLPQGEDKKKERVVFYKKLLEDKEYTLHFCSEYTEKDLLEENNGEKQQTPKEVEKCVELFFSILLKNKQKLGREKVYSYLRCYCGDDPRDLKEMGLSKEERTKRRVIRITMLLSNIPKHSFDIIYNTLKKGKLPED